MISITLLRLFHMASMRPPLISGGNAEHMQPRPRGMQFNEAAADVQRQILGLGGGHTLLHKQWGLAR